MSIGDRPLVAVMALLASTMLACALADFSGYTGGANAARAGDLDGGSGADGSSPPGSALGGPSGPLPSNVPDAGKAYAAYVREDNPVAYYRFEEDSLANAAKDEIGGPSAPASAKAGFGAAGVAGRAVALDGKTTFDIGDRFDFAGKVPFALEVWVKAAARNDGDQYLFHKRAEGGPVMAGYLVYLDSDANVHFEGWGVTMSAWTNVPVAPRFTHVVVSVSYATGRGNATLWIDAQRAPNGGYDNEDSLADTAAQLRFGDRLLGTIDELAIYDKELSADRVLAHYRAGTAPP